MKVAIVGGGAAGFFASIQVKEVYPNAEVYIFEKTKKCLAKVKVSGGGRCNVTNGEADIKKLILAYPRGGKSLRKAFSTFNTSHTREWFESRGVPLVLQEDGCVFPHSQDSQSIIDCFYREIKRLGIVIKLLSTVIHLEQKEEEIYMTFRQGGQKIFDKVIIATGGSPGRKGLEWLEKLGHLIEEPVPSLFTFNMPNEPIRKLMGVVVEKSIVNIPGFKYKADGPLLITHWGMSGPAILKLSAYGARHLSEQKYNFTIQVNWVNQVNTNIVLEELNSIIKEHEKKQLSNIRPFYIPDRLWTYLLDKMDFPLDKRWNEIGKKGVNKIVNTLTNDIYEVSGKTTFKEEFVTCGGISLDSINMKTMESKVIPNVYFAGELMDVDGITGGYNFQAAWTTGFIAGKLM